MLIFDQKNLEVVILESPDFTLGFEYNFFEKIFWSALHFILDKTEEKKSIDDFMLKRNDIGDFMLKRNGKFRSIHP